MVTVHKEFSLSEINYNNRTMVVEAVMPIVLRVQNTQALKRPPL